MMIRPFHRFPSLLVAALFAVPAFAASDYFLELDGIPGESKDQAHPAVIQVESFSFGASNSGIVGGGGGGAGTGKVSFSDISFSKVIDKTSPLLYLNTANGKILKKATLFVRRTISNAALDYYTVTLSDALLTRVQTSGQGDALPRESFSLSFSKIEISYIPQKADGSLDKLNPVKSGWDVVSNKAL